MDEPVYTQREHEELTPHAYKQLFLSLYAYRLGAISFLELVARFEDTLGIETPSDQCERMYGNAGHVEREG